MQRVRWKSRNGRFLTLFDSVPVICAIVVLVFLHRRHTKKLLHEDAMDKHKSLDFGMDDVTPRNPRKLPNGLEAEMSQPSHSKGLSLDVSPVPVLLPGDGMISTGGETPCSLADLWDLLGQSRMLLLNDGIRTSD